MNNDEEIVESLIAGGVIGAALGALLSKNKEGGTILGAIAGAAILATFKANEAAKKTKIPMFIEEDDALYEIKADGSKRFVKNIEKSGRQLPKTFKLR